MNSFDEQTIKDLEFSTIREWLTNYALGDTAKKRLVSLLPSNRFEEVKTELNIAKELLSIRTEGERFPALDFEEILKEIKDDEYYGLIKNFIKDYRQFRDKTLS